MSEMQAQRDIGKLQGDVEALQRDVAEIKKGMNTLLEAVLTAKGGWRTLMIVGGAVSVLTAAIFKLLSLFWRS